MPPTLFKIKDQYAGMESKTLSQIKTVLITQPKPESDKSPYYELGRKHEIDLVFEAFIRVEPVPAKEFRKQKIDIGAFTAVIFTSRNSIDNFFRICDEMRITVPADLKYFCITEAVALYLQKFIQYRKRKVFFGSDGTNMSLFKELGRFKSSEKFLYPCSENFDSEITNWLASNSTEYATPVLYEIISNDVQEIFQQNKFEIICFFTPLGIKSFFENLPDFQQNDILIAVFGDNTRKAALAAGLRVDILAPQPEAPSMISALDNFLSSYRN